jgi:ferric-dicitrate binding protein FerR (iron transport regulator)
VEVTGEVYFEVAKQPGKKFFVNVKGKGVGVEVLGTHFNINAYDDETAIKTTLLEGAVKVVANGKLGFLKPGQQAKVGSKGELDVEDKVDTEEVMAWKNGSFLFQNADIETIMRQVQRWYDVEIVYEGTINRKFYADLPRSVSSARLFTILENTGWVRFKAEGRKIMVIPVNK